MATDTYVPESAATEATSQTAGIGDTITLATQEDYVNSQPATQLEVTLLKVTYKVPLGEFDSPAENGRYFAVMLRITNVGEGVYSDSPSNGAAVVNRAGNQFDASMMMEKAPSLPSGMKLRPGASRTGWLTFDVAGKVTTFQFTPDSGFGPETGEWQF